MYEEVTTPEAGLTKLFGEMEYLLEKATSEPDQKVVGFHSYLLCFFQFIVDVFASCLRLKNHFNTHESVISFDFIIREVAYFMRDKRRYVGPTCGVILLNEDLPKIYISCQIHSIIDVIEHLYHLRERMNCLKHIYCYDVLVRFQIAEVHKSFDQVYGVVIYPSWFEVRRYWLDYITSATKKVVHVFWRDEIQETCGNLPHIHCVVAMDLPH